MTRFRFLVVLLSGALLWTGAAKADVYGFVEDGRVRLLYTDQVPSDPRFKLYKRDGLGSGEQAVPLSAAAPFKATRYGTQIQAAADETKVDAALIHAVIRVESGFNPRARSPAGAVGLMQLMPDTAKRYGVTNRLDPAQSIMGGAKYLKDLMEMFGNDLKLVLAAYNAGEAAVMKYGQRIPPYRETRLYVPKVLSHYQRYRGPKVASAGVEG